jgi:hypothetical protein
VARRHPDSYSPVPVDGMIQLLSDRPGFWYGEPNARSALRVAPPTKTPAAAKGSFLQRWVGDRRVRVCMCVYVLKGKDDLARGQMAGTELQKTTRLAGGRTRVIEQGCPDSCFGKMIHGSIVETALCIRRATASRMLVGWYNSDC